MSDPATAVLPRVAIVGRPNVGKSTLFNRIVGFRKAIVEDEPGTTRDRVEADVEWLDRRFRIIDTGGYETESENVFGPLILAQIRAAMAEADIVLLCLDARDGLTASDYDIVNEVRRAGRNVIVVATKVDNEAREAQGIAEAASVGLGAPISVSALHDVGVGLLLDAVTERLPEAPPLPEDERIRVAIIGRPNVGKSMLVNALLGHERVIVSEVAGTTRDAVDIEFDSPEGRFVLIDTAGVRRPGKLGTGIERHSVSRTRAATERADVAVLVVDGSEGLTSQDTHIAGIALDAHRALVVAVNKVDLWGPDEFGESRDWAERQLRGKTAFAPWALATFTSALEARGLDALLSLIVRAREARRQRLDTGALNAALTRAMREHMAPVVHSKRLKLYYATQASVDPPTFVLFVNDPAIVHFSYRRYLERSIREAGDFQGTAIRLVFRGRSEDNRDS